jgi:hypothetical protein
MATATLALTNPSEGNAWTVTITGSGIQGGNAVNVDSNYASATVACTVPSLPSLFTMSNNTNSFSFYDGKYVTWRSTAALTGLQPPTILQHPTQGLSLDIWSDSLHEKISGSNTWSQIAGFTYSLRTDKYSLIYDYTNRYAPIYSKGGTLTISIA